MNQINYSLDNVLKDNYEMYLGFNDDKISVKNALIFSVENLAYLICWRWDIFCLLNSPIYRQVSNIRRTLVGNEIVDHSDVVGASPVGAAPTTSSFST